jgi:hypothetical protein
MEKITIAIKSRGEAKPMYLYYNATAVGILAALEFLH